ncbi:hypothetical protein ABEB36_013372 [Hypothenemus hampei]|uniref:PHD-type domain-containing protein n=1 Tax=Hypothenemus hampei TaxID=57062 RepID=A0ABD1E815_HYPHA
MSAEFTRDHCKIAVAKILQTIGWHSINSTPLEVLTDILSGYITEIAKTTNEFASEFGQTEPNLDHLGLAFQELEVNLPELEEYVTYVNFVPPAQPVPKYPIPKESNLNFLKPGSKEVVTRPIHINEHLPPMYPLLEEQADQPLDAPQIKESIDDQFKKPADVCSPEFKRLKREDEGARPTREISSVMMTTSGFLSPAREGKLPEAKAPHPPPEPPKPPSPEPPVPEIVTVKKKPEKKREKIAKDLMKSYEDKPVKKINNMKDILTMKRAKAFAASNANLVPNIMSPGLVRMAPPLPGQQAYNLPSQAFPGDLKLPPPLVHNKPLNVKPSGFNKALAAAKAKTEKLNTTITPISIKPEPKFQVPTHQVVDKLVTEPDRKKINILRKISNVKEKHEKAKGHLNAQLMQQTQDIVSKINLSSDITIEPINPSGSSTGIKHESYFDDGSPPDTPPTPRTPEILTHSPMLVKEKRKRKEKPDKPKVKKPRKQQQQQQPQFPHSHFLDSDALDITMGRPKTPDAHLLYRSKPPTFPSRTGPALPFPFLPNFGGPGLIPSLGFLPPTADFGFPPIPPKIEPKLSPRPIKSEPVEIVPLAKAPPVVRDPSPPPFSEPAPLVKIEETSTPLTETPKKSKEHKKEKKDKTKKKNKKEKIKDKAEKKKLKEAKKERLKIKKEKKKKPPKEEPSLPHAEAPIPKILLKVNSPSPRPETPDSLKRLNIKPIIKREEPSPERKQRESSPGLAQISALVIGPPKPKTVTPPSEKPPLETSPSVSTPRPPGRPRIHPAKPKPPPKPKKVEQTFIKMDADGNEVWICPACGLQDDGRPMIGCDGCDAWYHWVCVGIQVPPDENENWYCKPCLARKNEDLQDKKKKRKKKDKNH